MVNIPINCIILLKAIVHEIERRIFLNIFPDYARINTENTLTWNCL